MRFKAKILSTLTAILITVCAWPAVQAAEDNAQISVTGTVNQSTAHIGDLIQYSVKIEYPQTTKIRLPRPGTQLGGMSVKEYDPGTPKKVSNNRLLITIKYSLDSLVTGSYILGPLEIGWKPEGSEEFKTLKTDEIFIEITSLDQDNTAKDIRDVKKPVTLPSGMLPVVLIIAVLIAIAFAAWLVIRKKLKNKTSAATPVIVIAPAQEALSCLEKIKNEDLISKGLFKEYYFKVSGVLRRYIERRFAVPVTEKTTEEFISQMTRSTVLTNTQQSMIRSYLEHCDMVKFAKYEPSSEDTKRIFDTAREFVVNTKPQEQTPDKNGKKA